MLVLLHGRKVQEQHEPVLAAPLLRLFIRKLPVVRPAAMAA